MNRVYKSIQSVLFLLLLFLSTVLINVNILKLDQSAFEVPMDRRYELSPSWVKVLSLGQVQTLVDGLIIRALQESSLEKVHSGMHPGSYFDWDLATDLDPAFFSLYLASGSLLAVVRGDFMGARNILIKGDQFYKDKQFDFGEEIKKKHWGNKWKLNTTLAYIYLFELDDLPHAADAFKDAGAVPGCPNYLLSLKEKLKRPAGEYEVGLRLVNLMINGTSDSRVREGLLKKRFSLLVGQFLFELNFSFQRFLASQSTRSNKEKITPNHLQKAWSEFRGTRNVSVHDPWGGFLTINEEGKIVSTTPHNRVFGLD